MKYILESGSKVINMDLEDFGKKIIGMLDNFPIICLMDLEHNKIRSLKRLNKLNIN